MRIDEDKIDVILDKMDEVWYSLTLSEKEELLNTLDKLI